MSILIWRTFVWDQTLVCPFPQFYTRFSQNTIKQEKEIQDFILYLMGIFYKHKIDGDNLHCCSSCKTAQCPLLSTGVTCFKKGHIWQLRKEEKKKSFLIILTRCQDTGFSSSWENEIKHSKYHFIFWINSWGRLYAVLVQEATFSTAIR